MMQDAAAGGHATGRNDDGGRVHVVDLLRFLDAAHDVQRFFAQRARRDFGVSKFQRAIFAVAQIDLRDINGHGAVHVDGEKRNAPRDLQLPDVVHQQLRAIDGECGYHDDTAAFGYAVDNVGQRLIAEHHVGSRRRLGIIQDGLVVAADVAGKHHGDVAAILGDDELDAGGAQDVSGVASSNQKLGADAEFAVAGDR